MSEKLTISAAEKQKEKRLLNTWIGTFFVFFPFLIILGFLMRSNQGQWIDLDPDTFYAIMTMHGLGMASTLYSIAYAALCYLISTRYVRLSTKLNIFVYVSFLVGMLMLITGTLIGDFGAGWYMLYPLPFVGANWPAWSTAISIIAQIILGIGWLIGSIHVIYILAKRYGGFAHISGWQYFKKNVREEEKIPPIALVSNVSLLPGVLAFITGAVMLIMYLMQNFEPSLSFNPLLLKNMTFYFGHTLANITLYITLAWLYTLLPEFTGRPLKLSKVVIIGWNATFFFIVFAFFHHMYMDYSQPMGLQYTGQIASYLSAVPATAVSAFSVISQLYRSKVKWTIVPILLLLGTTGWCVGGFAAVIDSTIAINKVFHNTLWVPAHFHTYMLLGVVPFLFAFLYYYLRAKEQAIKDTRFEGGLYMFFIGAVGFLLMFYLGGMESVPRRFATYKGIIAGDVHWKGMMLAGLGAAFVLLILLGLFTMYFRLIKGLFEKDKITDDPHKIGIEASEFAVAKDKSGDENYEPRENTLSS